MVTSWWPRWNGDPERCSSSAAQRRSPSDRHLFRVNAWTKTLRPQVLKKWDSCLTPSLQMVRLEQRCCLPTTLLSSLRNRSRNYLSDPPKFSPQLRMRTDCKRRHFVWQMTRVRTALRRMAGIVSSKPSVSYSSLGVVKVYLPTYWNCACCTKFCAIFVGCIIFLSWKCFYYLNFCTCLE